MVLLAGLKKWCALLAGVLFSTLPMCVQAADSVDRDGVKLLRFSTMAPARSWIVGSVVQPMIDSMNEAADGRMRIEHYPGPVLGKANRQYDIVKHGVADFAVIVPSYKPERFKRLLFLSIPFVYDDSAAASVAIWEMIEEGYFTSELQGLIPISLWVSAPNVVHSRGALADRISFQGQKIRISSRYQAMSLQQLGAVGVAMPITDSVEALRKGIVDGVLSDFVSAKNFGIADSAHHHLDVPMGGVLILTVMNKRRFAALSAEEQGAILDSSGLAEVIRMSASIRDHSDDVKRDFSAQDARSVVGISGDEVARWMEAFEPVERQFVSDVPDGDELLRVFRNKLQAAKQVLPPRG